MSETLKSLYVYLLQHKGESLTEIDCLSVDGVTTENVIQLLEQLENDGKISLECEYIHYSIAVLQDFLFGREWRSVLHEVSILSFFTLLKVTA